MPILDEFKSWLDGESEDKRILPKSPIRAAFTYTLNQWEALCRYTEEGYLSFDNNLPRGWSSSQRSGERITSSSAARKAVTARR